MMMMSALLDFYSGISLKQQSVDRHVILRGHVYSYSEPTSFLLLLGDAHACLEEKQHISII